MARQRAGSVSLIGPRPVNEDSLHLADTSRAAGRVHALLAVADGMGGLSAGEVASRTAIEVLVEPGEGALHAEDLLERVAIANDRINEIAAAGEGTAMGTTLTSAVVIDQQATVAHIGDSRAYLVHDGTISLITEDHSRVGRLVREGVITDLEAMHHPQQNVLERALGAGDGTPDIYRVGVGPGDILFLCTDGLHTHVTAEEMLLELQHNASLQAACDRLAHLAEQRGSDDNITAVAWQYPEEPDGSIPDRAVALGPPTVMRIDRSGVDADEGPSAVGLPSLVAFIVVVYASGFLIGVLLSGVLS